MAYFLYFCYDLLVLTCFFTGCLFIRKGWPLEYKLLVILSGLTVLVEGSSQVSAYLKVPIQWSYNIYVVAETGLLVYILYRVTMYRAIRRWLIALLIGLPIGIGIIYSLRPAFIRMNETAGLFCFFVELISSCLFLIDALLDTSGVPLTRRPLFWLTCGMIIYCSSYILMHALISYITLAKMSRNYYLWNGFIANMCLYTGFLVCYISLRPAKSRQSPGKSFA